MTRVRIVTDSTAHFTQPDFARQHNITVVPIAIHLGKDTYRDGVDLNSEQFFEKVKTVNGVLPSAASPTVEQFSSIYEDVTKSSSQVVAIHLSSKLGSVFSNSKAGAQQFLGRCNIQVIDSATTSLGLGVLVEAAAEAAEQGASPDDIVKLVRGLIPRVYVVFFVESLEYLANNKRFNKAQAILGSMLEIKPFLTIEDGDLVAMEKFRTREQAVEKLIEFVSEFSDLEYLSILQSSLTENDDTRLIREQLALDFPGRQFPLNLYGPALGTFLGPNALGVIVFEGLPEDE
jgi:DegV family protein with EDD domain